VWNVVHTAVSPLAGQVVIDVAVGALLPLPKSIVDVCPWLLLAAPKAEVFRRVRDERDAVIERVDSSRSAL